MLGEHQKTAAHHMYVGFMAGVIITAIISLLVYFFFLPEQMQECNGPDYEIEETA
jgi:hypothetical protein